MKQFAAAIILSSLAMATKVDNGKPYISAEIRSHETFQYGRFVTKMRGSDKHGTLATFMTLWLGDEEEDFSMDGWNHINLQLEPHNFNKVTTNLIWSGFTNEAEQFTNFDPSNNWHEYDIRWTPEHITFLVDGVEKRREVHTTEDFNEALADLNKKQHLIMGFWTPNWAADKLEDDSSMPWYTRYDYVKAYDYMGLDVETGEDQFELRFEENFDGDRINTDRWHLASHSIGDSSCTFRPENAYVENGNLVLRMEKVGGSDSEPDHDQGENKKPDDKKIPDADWQVLPAPEPDSLDAAIEKTVRVGVTMVRSYLDDFSDYFGATLQ